MSCVQPHGEALLVPFVQPDCRAPVPRRECIRLMDVTGMRERNLQDSRPAGFRPYWDHHSDATVKNRPVWSTGPPSQHLVHDERQLRETRRTALGPALDRALSERAWYLDHQSTLCS